MSKKLKMIQKALELYGTNEIQAGRTNPKVLSILNNVSQHKIVKNTPWCAAFVGSVLKESGYQYSVELAARSYLKIGKKVKTPSLGDMVILWREDPKSWKGHVGFFIAETENVIYLLGGNQNNTVCIKPYPKKRVLEYREPITSKPMAVGKVTPPTK